MSKPKLVIVYNKVFEYRVRIFELLNEDFDLTVTYTDKSCIGKKYSFRTMYTPGYNIGPFFFHKQNLKKIVGDADAVIAISNIRWISLMRLAITNRSFAYLLWGIGVTASYENRLDSKTTWDRIRYYLAGKAEAILFYSEYPIKKYTENGIPREKLFVANNTVEVDNNFNIEETEVNKSDWLFVGTLYPQKGVDLLINAYIDLSVEIDLPVLNIIGGGPLLAPLSGLIADKKLQNKIVLHGPIYDKIVLRSFFTKSTLCISPDQAGLSVLMSMGYGVPFFTSKNAITGGEVFNIKHLENGIIYDGTIEQFKEMLIWSIENKDKVLEMGRRAKIHYDSGRKPRDMANAIKNAVKYSLSKKK